MRILKKLYPAWLIKGKTSQHPQNKEQDYHFVIKHHDLVVGKLYTEHENGKRFYCFEYSKDFKEQHAKANAVRKITGFKEFKVYKSEALYPFFTSRMPDPNRPIIRETIAEKKIDKHNPLEILNAFGKKTLDNAFTVRLLKKTT